MPVPRVLLLTGTPPGDGSVGEIFLRELCQAYPQDSLCCFTATSPGVGQASPSLNWLPMKIVNWPYDKPWRVTRGWLGGITALMAFQHARFVRIKKLLAQALQFSKLYKIELVWAVLDSPVIYHLAICLAKKLQVPLVATVWDPPERIVLDLKLDRYSRRIALRDFKQTLRQSLRCGVMSEAMRDEYEKKYGTQAIIMRHGLGPEERRLSECRSTRSDRFTIGFAGSLYAAREWQALLAALTSVNWRIKGKDIEIRVLGSGGPLNMRGRAHIEYLGWRPMTEVIQLLSEADVNYLPYWFHPAYSLSVRHCFPTKLTTYLAAGRPIFYHGPRDSSPTIFFGRFPAAICCHSLEEAAILDSLTELISNEGLHARMIAAGQEALDKELNKDDFLRRFAALIGTEAHELLPYKISFDTDDGVTQQDEWNGNSACCFNSI